MNKRTRVTSICKECDSEIAGRKEFCSMRCRKINQIKAKGKTKFLKHDLARLFQKMIRAEYGAQPDGYQLAVVDSEVVSVYRSIGTCVCVTCGKKHPWSSGLEGMHTGHFVAGRGNSVLLEEDNVAPQCSRCNRYLHGEPAKFRQWIVAVRGADTVTRLENLDRQTRSFTLDELVDLFIAFSDRLSCAQSRMKHAFDNLR